MQFVQRIKRGIRNPPQIIINRALQEGRVHLERILMPHKVRRFRLSRLFKHTNVSSLDELWHQLASRPCFSAIASLDTAKLLKIQPDLIKQLEKKSELAMSNQVELLGSGVVSLGEKIDWHKDYKTGKRWDPAYFRSIEYCNPELPSDVKFPWELSRMQWLIPTAQLYLLTKDERYAEKVKSVLLDWIKQNPVGGSVNWSCTMEVAMRIFIWIWFFHIFQNSTVWQDKKFRGTFLLNLYWHGIFTDQFIEESSINGNHYTADAAALVVAGLFWREGHHAKHWLKKGWSGLLREIDKQVYQDGVDFEASTAYHRLVAELFFIAAKYRLAHGLHVESFYLEHLRKMGKYAQAYMRNNGTCPLWGDADDARVIPFGLQAINDHRYLPCIIGMMLDDPSLIKYNPGDLQESIWWYGPECIELHSEQHYIEAGCIKFDDGGFYIMRNDNDHIFIDCGRVGLADRGGHGHNDCLSFSAMLQGCDLISDRGAYCYTSSYQQRDEFRSTSSHNTPQIDDEEINRFVAPDHLWNFHYDAKPSLITYEQGNNEWIFSGTHAGYQRLVTPVTPIRTLSYSPEHSLLKIHDELQGTGNHKATVPLHLASGVTIKEHPRGYLLFADGKTFLLSWESDTPWELTQVPTTISPSYGIKNDSNKLVWSCHCQLPVTLTVTLQPIIGED